MKRVILVDDMPKARKMLKMILEDYNMRMGEQIIDVVADFGDGIAALEYLKDNEVEMVFLDIEMPEMTGMDVAKELGKKENCPDIVFITAYNNFALDAWKTNAICYLVKPYQRADVELAIRKCQKEVGVEKKSEIYVRCFPGFSLFINDRPISFKHKKPEEILAYLIHQRGEWISVNELAAELFEDLDEERAKNSLRSYMSRLKAQLSKEGIGDIIEQTYGKVRVNQEKFECDYYQYLDGDTDLFAGSYMKKYSWAESTFATMIEKLHEQSRKK